MKTQNPRIPIISAASHEIHSRRSSALSASSAVKTAPHQPSEYSIAQKHVATGHNADGDSYRISSQARAEASARSAPSTPGCAGTPPAWAQLLIFAALGCAVAWIVASLLF